VINKSGNRFRDQVLSALPDLLFVMNDRGIYLDAHASDPGQLRYPPDSFINKPVREVFDKPLADLTLDRIRRLRATGEIQEYTYSLEMEGEERFFEARMVPLETDTVLVIVRDVSEKNRMAALTEEQEQYLRAILQTTQDGFWVVDTGSHIVEVNEAYCNLTGYTREEMLRMSIGDLDEDEEAEVTRARMERIIRNGHESFEARHRCKDGTLIDIEISASFMPLRGGRMVCFCRDVSERKRMLKRLNHSRDMMRYVIEHTRSSVAVHDLNRCYVYVSQRYLEEFGLVGQDIIGRHHYEVFPDLPQRWRDVHTRALAGEVSSCDEDPYIHSSGQVDWTRWECRPWYGEDGDIQGFIVYTEVITEWKQREELLRQALKDAQAATVAKSQFLANMSHEIRTPMNGVLGFTELLSLTSPTAEQADLIQSLRESGQRMMTIIDDILDFSRIEAGKMNIVEAPMDIRRLVESVIAPMKHTAELKGLEMQLRIDPLIPSRLAGDATRIGQILTNLLSNAIKFTESGSVSLRCTLIENHPDKVWLRMVVEDTGIGISEAHLRKIFDPFYQVEASSTRRYGGSGLGLAICRQLAQLMNGKLEITSQPGDGTQCRFCLPLRRVAAEPEVSGLAPSVDHHAAPGARVLVVEDDPQSRKLAQLYLQRLGVTVTTADNGREALELLSQAAFDLVFMDCRMPEMNGYEATEAIRSGAAGKRNQAVPIVALTAYAMRHDAERCHAVGMNDYVSKPIQLDDLRPMVDKWIPSRAPRPTD
jgi:PAS domain S-box-containing protein